MARTKKKEAKIRPAALGKTRPCVQYPIKIKKYYNIDYLKN